MTKARTKTARRGATAESEDAKMRRMMEESHKHDLDLMHYLLDEGVCGSTAYGLLQMAIAAETGALASQRHLWDTLKASIDRDSETDPAADKVHADKLVDDMSRMLCHRFDLSNPAEKVAYYIMTVAHHALIFGGGSADLNPHGPFIGLLGQLERLISPILNRPNRVAA